MKKVVLGFMIILSIFGIASQSFAEQVFVGGDPAKVGIVNLIIPCGLAAG